MIRSLSRLPLLLALAVALPAFADDNLIIPKTAHAPRLDDYTKETPPADAGVEVSGFRQNQPGDGDDVTLSTKVYLSYDEEHLYAVFVCIDDPKEVRARIARREDIFGDEGVQILLDTYHDHQRAFVFSANPYGVQLDSKLTEGLGYDFNFDTQWKSDGRITEHGYVVTMAIPFKSLRFAHGDSQTWGIALGRIIPRKNEFAYWPYITQRKEGFVPQFGTATIADEIAPGRNIQVIPYTSFRNTRALDSDPANPHFDNNNKSRGGVDAKFVLHDSLALDLTANPDFSEVESDEPQVIVNQRFEVLFPEKRPFFLENAGFFGTPNTLFFSRRVVDPQYGARLTGRLDRWSLGGLVIDDRQAGGTVPFDPLQGPEDRGRIGVARVQRDVGTQSNVGVLLTDRDIGDHNNTVAGFDTRLKLDDNWTFAGQAVRSRTRDELTPDADGHLLFAEFTRTDREFNYDFQYADIGRDFNTELGFVPRTDIRQAYQNASYLKQFPDAPWLVSAGPQVIAYRTWDTDGRLQDWSLDAAFVVNGLRATKLEAHWLDSYEFFGGQGFHKSGWQLGAKSEWLSWLTASASISDTQDVNHVPAAGLSPFLADARQVNASLTWSPLAQLRVDQSYIWNDLRTRGDIAGHGDGSNVFRNTLWRTKVNYQFSRFLAARVVFDYAGLEPDSDLFGVDRAKRLSRDVLLSYTLNPGTALYVGYTDRQDNLRLFGNPRLVERTHDLDLRTGRQFFVKFSYLFDF